MGNMDRMTGGDRMLRPREHGFIIPGPEAYGAKLALEKYFL